MQRGKPAVLFILITLLLDTIGLGIIIPVLPKLVQELTGASISETSGPYGWLIAVYAIMLFLFSPTLGALSDQYGRRPVLLLTLAGMIINYGMLSFAPGMFWLFLGRIIAGMAGANVATAYAYIADVTPADKRAQNFGLIGAAFGIGFIIGPGIGGLLGTIDIRAPFIGAGALTLLNLLYGIFVLPESLSVEQRRPFSWKRANPFSALLRLRKYPFMLGLMAVFFLIALAAQAPQTIWVLFTEYQFGWNSKQVGLSLGVLGLAFGISQGWLSRYIIPALGERRTLVYGIFFYMGGVIIYGIAHAPWLLFCGLIIHALGILIVPAIQSLASRETPPNAQGELQGTFTSLMSLANIFGPLLATQLFKHFSGDSAAVHLPGMPFFVSAALLAGAALLIVPTFRQLNNKPRT
jgi:DHA1 family tetracycline resistance protein-like MFS transporter